MKEELDVRPMVRERAKEKREEMRDMVTRMMARWGSRHRPSIAGIAWMAALLGTLLFLDRQKAGIFLVPPFAATMTILLYLPEVSIAQPVAVVFGSTVGAAIGTILARIIGFGPGTAMVAAVVALIVLPLLRTFHPPGIALAMYPGLLHPGGWFPLRVVLPFTLTAVISAAALSRLSRDWPRYPMSLRPNALHAQVFRRE